MMRLLVVGIWACLATLGSVFGAVQWQKSREAAKSEAHTEVEVRKTRPMSVPMISDGRVAGYVIAQFAFTLDSRIGGSLGVPPDVFLLDEAFKTLYGDPRLDFRHLERFDVGGFGKLLVARVNARLGVPALTEVLLQEFTYVARADVHDGKPSR